MIVDSPSLLAREQQIFSLHGVARATLREEGAGGDVAARVAANAMIGVHRALVDFARGASSRARATSSRRI